jgi:hypothetical protein
VFPPLESLPFWLPLLFRFPPPWPLLPLPIVMPAPLPSCPPPFPPLKAEA